MRTAIAGRYSVAMPSYPRILKSICSGRNIVLCNPPHETFAKAKQPKPASAVYDSQAAEVLHRVVKRKPVMFGFVLPRAFADGQDFRVLREEVTNAYADVSVVMLPDKAFGKAGQETALLIAHNLRKNRNRYYSANVSEEEWEAFLQTRKPFDEYETTALQRNENNRPILWHPPLQRLWDYLDDCPTLDAYAEVHRGIEYNRPVEECVFDTPQPYTRTGVQTMDGYLEAFVVKRHQYLSVNPEEMKYLAYQLPWKSSKGVGQHVTYKSRLLADCRGN